MSVSCAYLHASIEDRMADCQSPCPGRSFAKQLKLQALSVGPCWPFQRYYPDPEALSKAQVSVRVSTQALRSCCLHSLGKFAIDTAEHIAMHACSDLMKNDSLHPACAQSTWKSTQEEHLAFDRQRSFRPDASCCPHSAGLAPTVGCCQLAMTQCVALEQSHGLMLAPRLIRDLWPACEQVKPTCPSCPYKLLLAKAKLVTSLVLQLCELLCSQCPAVLQCSRTIQLFPAPEMKLYQASITNHQLCWARTWRRFSCSHSCSSTIQLFTMEQGLLQALSCCWPATLSVLPMAQHTLHPCCKPVSQTAGHHKVCDSCGGPSI